jgi:hypothetical protein
MLSITVLRNLPRVSRAVRPTIRTYAANWPTSTPSPDEIRTAAASGVQFSQEQVAEISRREQAASPTGQRVHGGPASVAQSIYAKQQQLGNKLNGLNETPADEITEKDVGELQSAMVKGRGGKPVEKDNIVSDLHRVAQANESEDLGAVPVNDVTKAEAAAIQRAEALATGTRENIKRGPAAQAQSIADKTELWRGIRPDIEG